MRKSELYSKACVGISHVLGCVRFGSIAVIQPLRVRASLNVCSTPGVHPLWLNWFHRTPIHTILDERLGIFESVRRQTILD